MQYWIPGAFVASFVLSGCSMWSSSDVKTEQPYKSQPALQVPAELTAPKQPANYVIPPQVSQGALGDAVALEAPMQVLAVAAHSSIDEEEKEVRVWFERTEYTGDLTPYLQQQLQAFLQKSGIALQKNDGLRIETGVVQQYQETGWWLWKDRELSQESRFAVTLQPKPHGRSVAMQVSLLEHKYVDPNRQLNPITQRREEVNFLNRVIDHMATVELVHLKAAKAKQKQVSLASILDSNQVPVLVSNLAIGQVWTQLELIFEQSSLAVTDINQTDYRYFVRYTKPDNGFWDSLWGEEPLPELQIAEAEYIVSLRKSAQGTEIVWTTVDGKPLKQAEIDSIFQTWLAAANRAKIEI